MKPLEQKHQVYDLPRDVARWFGKQGLEFFQQLNLRENDSLLDFGARTGNYAIPAAMLVGPRGKVFALDIDEQALEELTRRAHYYNLENVEIIKTKGEVLLPLPDESVNFILFYDVLYSLCKRQGLGAFQQLLPEFSRVLKKGGILSIFFGHYHELGVSLEELIKLTTAHFKFSGAFSSEILHWDSFAQEEIHMFKKE